MYLEHIRLFGEDRRLHRRNKVKKHSLFITKPIEVSIRGNDCWLNDSLKMTIGVMVLPVMAENPIRFMRTGRPRRRRTGMEAKHTQKE